VDRVFIGQGLGPEAESCRGPRLSRVAGCRGQGVGSGAEFAGWGVRVRGKG
jgi:hypothetical protein